MLLHININIQLYFVHLEKIQAFFYLVFKQTTLPHFHSYYCEDIIPYLKVKSFFSIYKESPLSFCDYLLSEYV